MIVGLTLVTLVLIIFLGDIPISLIAALTIPCSLFFAFSLMVFSGRSANLISIGAIDFGILVDAAVIVLENIFRRFQSANSSAHTFDLIADATAEAVRPVAFSVLVIIVALIPLFTMEGVPGKVFAPMSETYGFALIGAFLFAVLFAPVLTSWMNPEKIRSHHTQLVSWLGRRYAGSIRWTMSNRKTVLAIAGVGARRHFDRGVSSRAGNSCPNLRKGTSGFARRCRKTLPTKRAPRRPTKFAKFCWAFPAVTQVVSQMGRPDDGTDVTTFNNIEFMVSLKPSEPVAERLNQGQAHQPDGRAARKISRH